MESYGAENKLLIADNRQLIAGMVQKIKDILRLVRWQNLLMTLFVMLITEKAVVKEVARIQKISQGKKLDERIRLLKLTMIGEKHRDLTFELRRKYLNALLHFLVLDMDGG